MSRNSGSVLAVTAVLAVTGLTACGDPARSRPVPLPTSNVSESATSMAASLEGILDGDPVTGCVWVEGDSEHQEPVTVRWPRGYRVEFEPLRLYDAEGQELARGGDRVQIAGGFQGESLEACEPADKVFYGRPRVEP